MLVGKLGVGKGLYTPSEKRACNSAFACRDGKVLVVTPGPISIHRIEGAACVEIRKNP